MQLHEKLKKSRAIISKTGYKICEPFNQLLDFYALGLKEKNTLSKISPALRL